MTPRSAGPAVVLGAWHRAFSPGTVGGSLYAVAAEHRVRTAALLDAAGCRVHVDVIVGPGGHRGVTWVELSAVRAALPAARVDLHLMVLDVSAPEVELEALDVAGDLRLQAVTLTGDQVERHSRRLARLRRSGVQVWEQVAPGQVDLLAPGLVDGALVMLIEPGSSRPADLDRLRTVGRLSRRLPVGVDGGVTPPVAEWSQAHGAAYLVSGRALLQSAVHA